MVAPPREELATQGLKAQFVAELPNCQPQWRLEMGIGLPVYCLRREVTRVWLVRMPKYYRKLIPGYPYTKPFFLTQGFEDGVGYLKNFFKHNPAFVIYMSIFSFSAVAMASKTYKHYTSDPDMVYRYKKKYTVMRKEDIADPDKECYN